MDKRKLLISKDYLSGWPVGAKVMIALLLPLRTGAAASSGFGWGKLEGCVTFLKEITTLPTCATFLQVLSAFSLYGANDDGTDLATSHI